MTSNVYTICTGIYSWGRHIYPRVLSRGRVYQGDAVIIDYGSDHFAVEALDRMTAGGVQWVVDPKVDRTTRWRLRVDPMALSYNEYWRYLLSHYMAQNVQPISIQGRRV